MYTEKELRELLRRSEYRNGSIKAAVKFLSDFAPSKTEYDLIRIAREVCDNGKDYQERTA